MAESPSSWFIVEAIEKPSNGKEFIFLLEIRIIVLNILGCRWSRPTDCATKPRRENIEDLIKWYFILGSELYLE